MIGILKGIFGIGYTKKKIINVIRVESDEFTICTPKLVNTRKHVFGEKNRLVHYTDEGVFTVEL
jgi:hypothetical protein